MASISVVKDNLYLLAKLPDKELPNLMRRQRIPLKMKDSPANQRVAKKQLAELERQLQDGTFDWSFWVDDSGKTVSWREAIRRLYERSAFWAEPARAPGRRTTWADCGRSTRTPAAPPLR